MKAGVSMGARRGTASALFGLLAGLALLTAECSESHPQPSPLTDTGTDGATDSKDFSPLGDDAEFVDMTSVEVLPGGDTTGLSCSAAGPLRQCPDGFTCQSTPCPACYFGPIAVCVPDLCDGGCYDDAMCGEDSVCIGDDVPAGLQGACLAKQDPPACWSDEQCPAGAGCTGAVYCQPCETCVQPDQVGTCTPTDPNDSVFLWVPGEIFNGMAEVTPVWFNLGDEAIYLAGCSTYVQQRKSGDPNAWTDKGSEVDCLWEGIARKVEPGSALVVEPFRAPDVSPDGWMESRLHGQYWTGCTDDQPISEADCTAGPFDVYSIPFLSGSAF